MKVHAALKTMDETLCHHLRVSPATVIVAESTDLPDEITCAWCRHAIERNIDYAFRMITMPVEKRRKLEQWRNRIKLERILMEEPTQ